MRKTLLALSCLFTAVASWAQTDVTSAIKNPSFENGSSGWKMEYMQVQTNSAFTAKSGEVYFEKWVSKGNAVGDAKMSQVISLQPGVYTLTVAAQNLNENSVSQKCSGAYIFADDYKTQVYTPSNYTLTFTNIYDKVEIGFVASGATGNWLAIDNFRLTKVSDITPEQAFNVLTEYITEAKTLVTKAMKQDALDALNAAISQAQQAIDSQSMSNVADCGNALKTAIADAKASIEYTQFEYNILNPGHVTGTAPEVTSTYNYVPTGSTEALVRATFKGSSIKERGVCWSTSHNPTVLDARTTKNFTHNGTIIHVKGLKPATVYYLRPYVMNTAYEVAYGDELKIVTHPKGTCSGSWNEGAPTVAANERCRNAIKETIDYFNEWTGIKGFHLTGNYGAGTPTADCSYGGWMRIGPNAGNQAIGTVIHETGHGVGVGTCPRWNDTNVHNGKWYGRETNTIFSFLENIKADPYNSDITWRGDGSHAWGSGGAIDWLVNGADKDKHWEYQYIGGCCLLYGMFVDGLNPTTAYTNGLAGYSYNFDDRQRYYIMCKSSERGLGDGLLYQSVNEYATRTVYGLKWMKKLTDGAALNDADAWYLEYDAENGNYRFRNAYNGYYITHTSTALSIKEVKTPGDAEGFQLMPDRTDVTVSLSGKSTKTHGFWFTWGGKAMQAKAAAAATGIGTLEVANFDFTDGATAQQWIILTEEQLREYLKQGDANSDGKVDQDDVNIIVEQYLGNNPKGINKGNADVNKDGQITITDANAIINK